MSKILCVIDGMTDPYFRVNNYPNLSSMRLLRHVDTTQGQTPESLGCILRLLGIKRVPPYLRGYAEALGYGIPVNKNDLIFRGSWFSLDEQGCCNVPTSAPESLSESEGHYYHLGQYKSLLIFPDMANCIADMVTYAPYACNGKDARTLCPKGCAAASRVFHAQLAKDHCDVGVNADIRDTKVLNRKIAYGTQNIFQGPAMTREQTVQAIMIGMELAKETEADVIGIGEMGIGNTTTSSAVLSVLLDADVDAVTGRGGGITNQSFQKKKQVIQTAIEINQPDKQDVIDVLSKVGGFDIAAMCGAFVGCAATRRPVVIDGFISAVAALCAYKLCPNAVHYFIPSHASYEIGYQLAMDAMNLTPIFLLGMRLGEGSGCPLAFEILSAACAVINDMATFDEAGINDDYLEEIRQGDKFTP